MLSRNCIHCLAPAVRRAAVVTPTFVPARSVTISTNTRKPKTKPKPSTKPKPAAADGSVPAGPLPTDPLAPPPPSSPPPLPPYEPRATSAILDDEYLRPKRWISDPGREDNKLSPYGELHCVRAACWSRKQGSSIGGGYQDQVALSAFRGSLVCVLSQAWFASRSHVLPHTPTLTDWLVLVELELTHSVHGLKFCSEMYRFALPAPEM